MICGSAISLCTRPAADVGQDQHGEGVGACKAGRFRDRGLVVGLFWRSDLWIAARSTRAAVARLRVAISATVSSTERLHEEGLADTPDGFGGGKTREYKRRNHARSRVHPMAAARSSSSLRCGWWEHVAEIAEAALVAGSR